MSHSTKIEWTDATWNPVTGCTKVSPGCDHCYAERITERFHGRGSFADVVLHPERLDVPLRWRKPRRVFVNSMSDLFHDAVPDKFIARVFAVMGLCDGTRTNGRRHTFQVLTKRPGRMASLLSSEEFAYEVHSAAAAQQFNGYWPTKAGQPFDYRAWKPWPLPNVWLGTSVEDQRWADIRIPQLLRTPAAVRFLSMEPLLGPVSIYQHIRDGGIGWVIVGGESGPGHRPIDADWVRNIRDECQQAGVPFFFKQWGGARPKSNGRELDGRTWDEYPQAVAA